MASLIEERKEVVYTVELTEDEMHWIRKQTNKVEDKETRGNRAVRLALKRFFADTVSAPSVNKTTIDDVIFNPDEFADAVKEKPTYIPSDSKSSVIKQYDNVDIPINSNGVGRSPMRTDSGDALPMPEVRYDVKYIGTEVKGD